MFTPSGDVRCAMSQTGRNANAAMGYELVQVKRRKLRPTNAACTTYSNVTHFINNKTSAVMRSRISSNLIFASCVGYFDRAYYGSYVTSSRTLILIEEDKI